VVREQEQAVKAALLKEALEPAEPGDPLPLAARAAAFGIDFSRPARLVVVRRHADLKRARRILVTELDHAHAPHLAYERGRSITALVQCDDDVLDRAVHAVSEALPAAAIGIGRPVAGIAEAHHSLHDAELAADGEGITRFEDFDLGTFLVSEIPPERLGPKVDEILSALRDNPPIYEALSAYFAHDLDIASTAEALHMHRNSLRYRLARAEHMLGRSLKQPSTIAAVYLALVAEAAQNGDGVRMPKAAR
jgi:sugar diacid utilization regulator